MGHRPIDEPCCIRSNVVVLQGRADSRLGQERLHRLCNRRELARRDHVDRRAGLRWIAVWPISGARTVAKLIPAKAIGAVQCAERLGPGIVDGNHHPIHCHAAEISALLGRRWKRDWSRCGAGVSEAVVVSVIKDLVLPGAEWNERTAEVNSVLIAVLNRLYRNSNDRINGLSKPAPGIQGRVPEELVHRTVILVAALLDGVVHHSLAFVHSRVTAGLHLELVHRIHRDCGPHITWVAIAAGTHKWNAVDVDRGNSALAA